MQTDRDFFEGTTRCFGRALQHATAHVALRLTDWTGDDIARQNRWQEGRT